MMREKFKKFPLEALFWVAALLLLALSDNTTASFSFCPFRNAGIDLCPGCGLGRSITLFFKGDISASIQMHPMGIFGVFILSFRVIKLTKQYLKIYGQSN